MKVNLIGLNQKELEKFFLSLGEKSFRSKQVYQWIHQKGISDFHAMTNISKELQEKLSENAEISAPKVVLEKDSRDGTRKWVLSVGEGDLVEMVLIPEGKRATLCISSQVGCAVDCSFCATGKQGFSRNLELSEIIGQLWVAENSFGVPRDHANKKVTNVVMMGMGEPLHNYDQLVVALRTMNHNFALRLSNRKITVSSVGLLPALLRLTEEIPVNIAISLNATTEEQRRTVMPITKKYSLKELLDTCLTITQSPNQQGRRITFEYVMMKGFNDSLEDAKRLTEILKGIPSKINLIPYNENPDREIERPAFEQVKAFQTYLVSRGWYCSIRTTRGIDISAACGQLGKAFQIIKQPT